MILKFIKNHLSELILFFIVLIIGICSFRSGKWITGWDNLHPEFDFVLNIKRSIFAVWQENQGLGLVGGLGHAAELPRQIFLLFMSFFVPQNQLRFIFFLLCLLAGALGMNAFLSKYVTFEKKSSLFGALYYIFNLATIQTFYIQYESFVVQYATLPWLFLTVTWVLKENSQKAWIWFTVVGLLSIPQGFVPTLFIVTYGSLGLYILFYLLINQHKQLLYSSLKIMVITLMLNAFWILPFVYFNIQNLHIVKDAKINEMSSQNLYLNNLKASTLLNAIQLKGFWFNTFDFDSKNIPLMTIWEQYIKLFPIQIINIILFALVFYGVIIILIKKNHLLISFVIIFAVLFTILANQQFPFSIMYLLIEKLPLFNEVFRIYFTKISVLAGFTYSVLFSIGFLQLLKKLQAFKIAFFIQFVITTLLVVSIFPVFLNGLFYKNIRLAIPNEYFQVMDFFSHENPNERIANLPQHTYVYWNFYNWKYRGSGFLWYGINQPILDRAFDVWSPQNENYYWELSQSLLGKRIDLFQNVINKYGINWIMIDKNIIKPSNPKSIQYEKLQSFLSNSRSIYYYKSFGNIDIYKVIKQNQKNYVSIKSNLPKIAPQFNWTTIDYSTYLYGDYISTKDYSNANVFFLFKEINGNKNYQTPSYVRESVSSFIFSSIIPPSFSGTTLKIPVIKYDDIAKFDLNNLNKITLFFPKIYINDQLFYTLSLENLKNEANLQLPLFEKPAILNVTVPRVEGYNSYKSTNDSSFYIKSAESCDTMQKGNIKITGDIYKGLELTSLDNSNCIIQDIPFLNHNSGYIISLATQHIQGKDLQLQISKLDNKEILIDDYLNPNSDINYILLPEQDTYNIGYRILFNNISVGSTPTINRIYNFSINPIPYSFINSLRIEKPTIQTSINADKFEVKKSNYFTYKVILSDEITKQSSNLILFQSYSPGWVAFAGGKPLEHVLINNWANGWLLPTTTYPLQPIVIIFWPQYLEFLGFGLLVVAFLFILFYRPIIEVDDKNN